MATIDNFKRYNKAGFAVFGLHGAIKTKADGWIWDSKKGIVHSDKKEGLLCDCGNPRCKAILKHPVATSWQITPNYSMETLGHIIDSGQVDTGFGVLMKGLFVVDIDARNGGLESLEELNLELDIDLEMEAGFIVETGSSDGSMHLYFKSCNPPIALAQSLREFKGIDFKSTGYVVGAGSRHASGGAYIPKKGDISTLSEPPRELIEILQKKAHSRVSLDGRILDVSSSELESVVMTIPAQDMDYHDWIRVGMAIHHTTDGESRGEKLWDEWSATDTARYDASVISEKWESFKGSRGDLTTFATLMHLAQQNGYEAPVTFESDLMFYDDTLKENEVIKNGEKLIVSESGELVKPKVSLDVSHIDIRRPPNFAGELTQWINDQCLYPRENLSAGAALFVLSCVGGMRHQDEINDLAMNVIIFCVTGSGTGKEAINGAINELLKTAGVMPAVHGKFKSEQEAMRNLIRHQASLYTIDELGIELKKINNASKRGGASYLEGLFGFLMSVYSKANGILPVSGDLKEDIREHFTKEISQLDKKIDSGRYIKQQDDLERMVEDLKIELANVDNGIENPFLSIYGATTPVTFDDIVDFEMATNGFVARSIILRDLETNPRRKENFKKKPMPNHIRQMMMSLYNGGNASLLPNENKRVQHRGAKTIIHTNNEALDALDQVYEYFHELGEKAKEINGLEAITRRGWEIASKISLLTAMPAGIRTLEDVLYGFAVAKYDIESKMNLAHANVQEEINNTGDALITRIIGLFDVGDSRTLRYICNRLKKYDDKIIDEAIEQLEKIGAVTVEEETAPNGKETVKITRIK